MKTIGVKAVVTMSRTLYIEVPDEATDEDIINKAKIEIMLPHNALYTANAALNRAGISINKLDLGDWEVDKSEYIKIDEQHV